jgi:hypothetical protein
MIDVGNDREFSFIFEPSQGFLVETLGKVIETETRPAQQRRGFQLASFFEMPGRTESASIQTRLLVAAFADDAELRATAREVVRKDLVVLPDEAVTARVVEVLGGDDAEARAGVIAALARSPRALRLDPVAVAIQAVVDAAIAEDLVTADLLPLVGAEMLDDRQTIAVLDAAWRALEKSPASERIPVLEALAKREGLVGGAGPSPDPAANLSRRAVSILRDAATDRDNAVREKVFELLSTLDVLRKGRLAASVLYAGLSDESPAIRAKSLALAVENEYVWREEDVHEYILKLLIDADPKIRKAALDAVSARMLLTSQPRYAARVKAVMEGDEALQPAAEAVLAGADLDPNVVAADAKIAMVREPDIVFFRDHVNSYFYQKGADKNACADCHATHTILGLAEPPKDGRELTDEEIFGNYRSLLKVINVSDPEQSLVLRKPRSPFGTGQASEESATGVTHVGGTRWEQGPNDEAYQALLAFVRTAAEEREPMKLTASADSYSPEYPAEYAIDGKPDTTWHTEFVGAMPGYPHELVIAFDAPREVAGVRYLPRQDSPNGRVKEFEVYVSVDGTEWGEPVAKGTWGNDALPKAAFIPRTTARFVKLRGLSEVSGQPFMSVGELEVLTAPGDTRIAQAAN